MSTTPTEPTTTEPIDPELNEPTREQGIRMAALQYSSFISTKDTPLNEFLKKASKIETYILTGELKGD